MVSSLLLFWAVGVVTGFPSPVTAQQSRQFIEISNQIKSTTDKLPSSFVESWSTWVLDDDNGNSITKIPDTDGYVNPSSIDELWLPVDLKQPDVRLSLGLHVRDGRIRHIMPALDVSFDGKHRNRGLCSTPRAYKWLDFDSNPINIWNEFELTLATKKADDDDDKTNNEDWSNLGTSTSLNIKDSLETAINFIANNPPEELGTGSHIIHVIVGKGKEVCPKSGYELRALLGNSGEPEINFMGLLQVKLLATAAGSTSEYLPDVYKPLFQDETLQKESFRKYIKRKEQREAAAAAAAAASAKNNNDSEL